MKNESSIGVEEDEIICNCFQVTESIIRTHIIKKNIDQVEDVTLLCEAGGNCGSCHMLIQLFIDQNKHKKTLEHTPEPQVSKSNNNKGSFWRKLLSNT